MRWFASTCVLILVSIGLPQGIVGWKPRMTPVVEELLIQEGDDLMIECQGEGRLQFSTQQYLTFVNQSEFFISVNDDSGSYTFTRPNARGVDTGWYACSEEGIDILNDEQTIDRPDTDISWIYVYVNSSRSFAVSDALGLVPVVEGERVVIPCRPTSPDLPVTLEGHRTVIENSTYDPKLGFVIKGHRTHPVGQKFVTCRINDTDRMGETLNFSLVFYPKRDPWIKQGLITMGIKGQNLTLNCSAGTPATSPRLYWKVTDSVPVERYSSEVSSSLSEAPDERVNWRYWSSQLTIQNLERSDLGEYSCFERYPADGTVRSTKVTVWIAEPGIITGEDVRYVKVSDHASLDCEMEGYPLRDFTWGKIVDSEYEKHPSHNTGVRSLSQYKFRISTGWGVITRENNGTYECRAQGHNGTISHRTYLVVTEVPEIEIELATAVGAGSIFIRWTAFDGNKPIDPYPVQRRKNGTEEWQDTPEKFSGGNSSHLLDGLDASSAYQLRIIATNSIGTSQPAYSEWITTFDEDPQLVPNIWIKETSNTSITFEYEVPTAKYPDLFHYLRLRRLDTKAPGDLEHDTISHYIYVGGLETGEEFAMKAAFCSNYTGRCGNWSAELRTVVMDRDPIFIPDILLVEPTRDSIKISWTKPPEELQDRVHQYKVMATSLTGHEEPFHVNKTENSYVFKNLSPSVMIYRLKVAACSEYKTQCGNWSTEKDGFAVTTDDDTGRVKLLSGSMVGMFLLLSLIFAICMRIRSQREVAARKRFIQATLEGRNGVAPDCLDPELNMADQAEVMGYDKKWEFQRKRLKLGKVLGSGAFGIVMKAEARSLCPGQNVSTVAVKMVRATHRLDHMMALTRELKILAYLGKHVNVVNLLGACTGSISYGELLVIVEFCRFGNLHDYLRQCRGDFVDRIEAANVDADNIAVKENENDTVILDINSTIKDCCQTEDFEISSVPVEEQASNLDLIEPGQRSRYLGDFKDNDVESIGTEDLLNWAWQVSRGMKFLGIRRVMHGDLAARNILLTDNNVVKICDFGLAKSLVTDDIYKKSGHGPLPIKWMAIESIRDRLFSVKSDVWAFGVVLWELFSLAETPYPGIANDSVYQKLAEGFRMAQPRYATDDLYNTMLRCWDAEPSKRPSFGELEVRLADSIDQGEKTHFLAVDAHYEELNAEAITLTEGKDPSTVVASEESGIPSSKPSDDMEMITR